MKWKIGDRVIHDRYGRGKILGFIKEWRKEVFEEDDDVVMLVEFDKKNRVFHDGDGRGKNHHCYWLTIYKLRKIKPQSLKDLIEE